MRVFLGSLFTLAAVSAWAPAEADTQPQDLFGEWSGTLVIEGKSLMGDDGIWTNEKKQIEKRTVTFFVQDGKLVAVGTFAAIPDAPMPLASLAPGPKGTLVAAEGGTVGEWSFDVKGNTLSTKQVIDKQRHFVRATGTFKRVAPQLTPGRYKLLIEAQASQKKANGERWDPAGDPPDPIATVTVSGIGPARTFTCRQKDTVKSTCLSGTEIDVDAHTVVAFRFADEDAIKDDAIGATAPLHVSSSHQSPDSPIVLSTSGALATATLRLVPIGATTPAVLSGSKFASTLPPACKRYRDLVIKVSSCAKLPPETRDAIVSAFNTIELDWASGTRAPNEPSCSASYEATVATAPGCDR